VPVPRLGPASFGWSLDRPDRLRAKLFDVAPSFQGDSVDEPTYQLARYLSVEQSSNQGEYTDRELDRLFELQKDAADLKQRYALLRQFERRMLTEAYNVPLL